MSNETVRQAVKKTSKLFETEPGKATGGTAEWLTDRKSRRAFPHRLERCGYVFVCNPNAKDGYWLIEGARQPVYARVTLSDVEKFKAATELTNGQSRGGA